MDANRELETERLAREILEAADLTKQLKTHLSSTGLDGFSLFKGKISLKGINKIHFHGVGKAAPYMVLKLKEHLESIGLSELIADTFSIGKEGDSKASIESSHPIPSLKSVKAADEILEKAEDLGEEDLILFCLSGGASSLIVKPMIELELYQKISKEMLMGDFSIGELNQTRKCLDSIKNGGLLSAYLPAKVITLIISDVEGDDRSIIGSSPTMSFPIEVETAMGVLNQIGFSELNEAIKEIEHDSDLPPAQSFILLPYDHLLKSAKEICDKFYIESNPLTGRFGEVLDKHLGLLKTEGSLITSGEFSLSVVGEGKGGRNTHFVLSMAEKIFVSNALNMTDEQLAKVEILSIGSDGTDGETDAAGAFITKELFESVDDYKKYLNEFNSYEFFEKANSLIKTGPTGTNLGDLRIIKIS